MSIRVINDMQVITASASGGVRPWYRASVVIMSGALCLVKRRVRTRTPMRALSTSHLSIPRGATSEEVVCGLAAKSGFVSLLAARPTVFSESTGMIMHKHLLIEIAS